MTIYCYDSAVIEVKTELRGAPIAPMYFSRYEYNQRYSMRFIWGLNRHTYNQPHFYTLHIWKRPGIVPENSLKPNTNEVYLDTFFGTDTTTVLNGGQIFADTTQIYYWTVRTLDATLLPYGDNDGLATPIPIVVGRPVGLTGIGYIPIKNPLTPLLTTACGTPIMLDGFESGSFQGWGQKYHSTGSLKGPANCDTRGISNTGIDTKMYDNAYQDFTVYKGGGNYSANIGNLSQSDVAQSIHTTFTLSGWFKQNFNFWITAVCNSTGHYDFLNRPHPERSAKVIYRLYRGSDGIDDAQTRLVKEKTIDFNTWTNDNELKRSAFEVYAWQQICWDLHNVPDGVYTFEVITTTCYDGNHRAASKLDFCVSPTVNISYNFNRTEACRINKTNGAMGFADIICTPTVTPTADHQISYYTYYIYKSNKDGKQFGSYLNYSLSSAWTGSANSQVPNPLNVNLFLAEKKIPVDIDSFFIVELVIENGTCTPTIRRQLIKFKGIEKNLAGPTRCCPYWNCNVPLGFPPKSGYTYTWGPSSLRPCLSNPDIANPYFHPNNNCVPGNSPYVILKLYTNSTAGCSDSSEVRIIKDSLKITSLKLDTAECKLYIRATVNYPVNELDIIWMAVDSVGDNPWSLHKEPGDDPLVRYIEPHEFKTPHGAGIQRWYVRVYAQGVCTDTIRKIIAYPWFGRKYGPVDTLLVNTKDVQDTFRVFYTNAKNPNSRYNAFKWRMDVMKDNGKLLIDKASGFDYSGFTNGSLKLARSNAGYEQHNFTPIKVLFGSCTIGFEQQIVTIPTKTTCQACYGRHDVVLKNTYGSHADPSRVVINRFVPCNQDANMDADDVDDRGQPNKSDRIGHNEFKQVCVCKPFEIKNNGRRNYYTHGVIMEQFKYGVYNHPQGEPFRVLWKN